MAASEKTPAKDPHLPPMARVGDLICPRAPQTIAEARLEDSALLDLAVKIGYAIPRFSVDSLAERLHLSPALADAVISQLGNDGLVEETMLLHKGRPTYRLSEQGHRHAVRAMEVCAYIGPAPVSLEA